MKSAFNGAGYELLKKNAAELGRMHPRHKWIPWITIDGKVACRGKCNLQATVRRRICNARRGALPRIVQSFRGPRLYTTNRRFHSEVSPPRLRPS